MLASNTCENAVPDTLSYAGGVQDADGRTACSVADKRGSIDGRSNSGANFADDNIIDRLRRLFQ
jgi:hypothetical protein